MTPNPRDWIIRAIPNADLETALAAMLAAEGAAPPQVRSSLDALRLYTETTAIRNTSHLGAFRGRTLLAACLCYDLPGRTGLLFLPSLEGRTQLATALLDLLDAQTAAAAGKRDLALLQVVLEPELTETQDLLQRAGFPLLADLLYLECPVTRPEASPPPPNLDWRPYGPDTHHLFLRTIEQTYRQSLDCPKLIGRRRIEDVLEGHRGTCHFDTRYWSLAWEHHRPVAVLIVGRTPGQPSVELVYMGVTPEARGRKLGLALLDRANRHAFQERAETITCAVDAANQPALRMYRAFGFAPKTRRRAWVRFLNPSP